MAKIGIALAAAVLLAADLATGAGQERIAPACGALRIEDRTSFEVYADRNNFPGAMQVPEVKFTIVDVDTSHPQLYFMNTKNHPYHYDFVVDCLGRPLDLETFNRETYYTEHRKYLAGSIVAHDHYEPEEAIRGIYTLEFWPTDPVAFGFVRLAYDLVAANLPFAQGRLYYHAASETQRALYETEKALYATSPVAVIRTEDLFAQISYAPLMTGQAYGRLRILDGPATVSARDIVVYRTVPNTLSHVAGIITEVPQTPLSHINLKAQQNHTPNAYIRGAATRPEMVALAGRYVHLRIEPEGYTLAEATPADVDAFLDSLRPREPQIPPRNLSVTAVAPLAAIGFADSNSVGAKAANLAELAQLFYRGGEFQGYAVPFYFYDEFMKHNGFYEDAAALMADPAFRNDPQTRESRLASFRRKLRDGALPAWMLRDLAALQEAFPRGTSIRCRSSSNNEDLPGFNGAGLYESYTHHPDEGHMAKSMKQVWASLWTYRAFEERDFYRVDHLQAAMGVLVHQNYEDERANGVAVTKNIYDVHWPGYYVNVQAGEALVTNPPPLSIPDEFLVANLAGAERYEIQYIRHSNLVPAGSSLLTKEQVFELADMMDRIQKHFRVLYHIHPADRDFAMEIEFKLTAAGRLSIKQARPWIDR